MNLVSIQGSNKCFALCSLWSKLQFVMKNARLKNDQTAKTVKHRTSKEVSLSTIKPMILILTSNSPYHSNHLPSGDQYLQMIVPLFSIIMVVTCSWQVVTFALFDFFLPGVAPMTRHLTKMPSKLLSCMKSLMQFAMQLCKGPGKW